MDIQNTQARLKHLETQKQLFLGLLILVSLSLLICLFLLTRKNTHVVVVPAQLNQTVGLESHSVSQSYLEEMSGYFAHLLLDVTPQNMTYHHKLILGYVEPNAYGLMKSALLKEAVFLKKDDASSSFKLTHIKTDVHGLKAEVSGYLTSYLAGKQLSHEKKAFQFQFVYRHGALLIQSFEEIK